MSASNRTTAKGGKGSKTDNKSHKSEKSDSGKNSEKQQTNRENAHNKSEDPSIKEKVRQLIEMSHRSEEEVCLALHECDNDVNLASNMLFESMGHGEWEIRVKKKRNRQASASKQEKQQQEDIGAGVSDDWNDNQQQSGGNSGGGGGGDIGNSGNNNNITDKDRGRRGGGPPRSHGRSWRGRERHENERNLDESGRGGGDRRGRSSGSTRGSGGGRGRGGGRAGGRYPPRGNRGGGGGGYNKPIDTWDNSNTWDNNTNTNHTENWDDFPGTDEWSAEEYTGSLADTKVFTPSVQQTVEPEPPAPTAPPVPSSNSNVVVGGGGGGGSGGGVTPSIDNAVINTGQQLQTTQLPSQSPVPIAGTLNAAQTQYLNQLTQQNSDNLKQYGGTNQTYAQNSNQVYNTTTGTTQNYTNNQQQFGQTANTFVNNSYGNVNNNFPNSQDAQPAQQPTRTKIQRARVPPPSKIPASAVEMPGDLNSSIGYLDVQFGAMDFMSDGNSFDTVNETKFNSANLDNQTVTSTGNLDLNTSNQNTTLDAYSPKTNTQSSISSALSQSLTNSESIPQTTEHLTSAYNTAPRSTTVASATPSVTPSGLDMGKQGETHSYSQSTTYNSYQPKTNTYNASTYNASQVTSSSYVSNQTNNSYVNSQSTTYNPPSGNTYQNAYSSSTAGSYQSNTSAAAFPSMTQTNSYPTNNQTYQQSSNQSVYGGGGGGNSGAGTNTTGLTNSSNFGNTATSQYNSYSSTSNKLNKDNTYDSNTNPVSIAQTTTPNSVTTTALSLSQTTVSVTKSTTTLAKNSSNVVSNIPPGVPPVMSTPYIMGQVPYFQPPVYSYEEMQMLQQRLPHMTTPYYDMSYQTPTTLAAVRDATLSNVGYSISDGRFTRGDNNASPVPSTLSQQTSTLTQGHQAQPILAAGTAPPPYFFTAAFNTLTPNYQFGHMYTQLPTATNAHGSSSSTQYPKPAAYSSGYGNYDTLNQAQDYNKTGYVGNSQGQKGAGVNVTSTGSSGNDLSAMYGKSHAPLGKVNSYDKQGFHSGTPPPFTGALHGGQNAGLAPSGAGYTPQVYIPTLTAHQQQQLSTQMMHQPLHQMDVVRHHGRRTDSGNSSGQRSQTSNQTKSGSKQSYQPSYWNQA